MLILPRGGRVRKKGTFFCCEKKNALWENAVVMRDQLKCCSQLQYFLNSWPWLACSFREIITWQPNFALSAQALKQTIQSHKSFVWTAKIESFFPRLVQQDFSHWQTHYRQGVERHDPGDADRTQDPPEGGADVGLGEGGGDPGRASVGLSRRARAEQLSKKNHCCKTNAFSIFAPKKYCFRTAKKFHFNHVQNKKNYFRFFMLSICLFVCLFVCSDLEPKLLDGSLPNLAWATLRSLWVTSKYFFWVDLPRGGIILVKLKKYNLPHMAQDGAGFFCGTFCGTFCAFFIFIFQILILFNGPAERSEASQRAIQRVFSFWAAKRPAPS